MSVRHQPVGAPTSQEEHDRLVTAGVLINLGGDPLTPSRCPWCPEYTLGETCPRALTCPLCGARPGAWCARPSGHVNTGSLHQPRIRLAESTDQDRELAGDPTLPAPWPPRPAALPANQPSLFGDDAREPQIPLDSWRGGHARRRGRSAHRAQPDHAQGG